LRTGVPLELERIVNRCISKDPQDRYQHADDLLSELNRLKKKSESEITPTKKVIAEKRSKPLILSTVILSIVLLLIAGYLLIVPEEKSTIEWENSIAVLPFDNISNDPEQEYFCDGMTEQIISNLASLPRLQVIARQSVMKYKQSVKTIPEIGKELNVAHILEGSIRKFGDRIRVTAQLIKVYDGFHLWSEDFDRGYQDLFDVQDEVSEAIATNLLKSISVQEIIESKTKRPANTEAYEYYLKGKYFGERFWGETASNMDDFYTAENMYFKALEIDSNYALSYAGLADLYNTYCWYIPVNSKEREKYMQLHEKHIKKAFALDKSSSYVCLVMAFLYDLKEDFNNAYKFFKKSLSANDNDPVAQQQFGLFLRRRGLADLALHYMNRAIELNPLVPYYYAARGNVHRHLGKFDKATMNFRKALEFDPNHKDILTGYTNCLIDGMSFETAKNAIAKYIDLYPDEDQYVNYYKSIIFALDGDKKRSLQFETVNLLNSYLILEMREEAINLMFETFEQQKRVDSPLYISMKNQERFDILRSDPRFQEILSKHKELYEENLRKYGDIEELIN
jgi:TolB-like protein/Tfp pilus assembly protein PilF